MYYISNKYKANRTEKKILFITLFNDKRISRKYNIFENKITLNSSRITKSKFVSDLIKNLLPQTNLL